MPCTTTGILWLKGTAPVKGGGGGNRGGGRPTRLDRVTFGPAGRRSIQAELRARAGLHPSCDTKNILHPDAVAVQQKLEAKTIATTDERRYTQIHTQEPLNKD